MRKRQYRHVYTYQSVYLCLLSGGYILATDDEFGLYGPPGRIVQRGPLSTVPVGSFVALQLREGLTLVETPKHITNDMIRADKWWPSKHVYMLPAARPAPAGGAA
ncbi:MAG: hypothetical protein QM754_00575 [Tepidisphaeraceae bacterium]